MALAVVLVGLELARFQAFHCQQITRSQSVLVGLAVMVQENLMALMAQTQSLALSPLLAVAEGAMEVAQQVRAKTVALAVEAVVATMAQLHPLAVQVTPLLFPRRKAMTEGAVLLAHRAAMMRLVAVAVVLVRWVVMRHRPIREAMEAMAHHHPLAGLQ